MNLLIAAGAGVLFGCGLILSGMADPSKVLGFLDITGLWNPSLALVMAGAVGVGLAGFAVAARLKKSLLGLPMPQPPSRRINRRLIVGSLVFGIGWGLAGICPGPAFVLIGAGSAKAALFTLSMIGGMWAFEWLEKRPAVNPG
jgi:uncharacterized membrane protein YedE/YeeE